MAISSQSREGGLTCGSAPDAAGGRKSAGSGAASVFHAASNRSRIASSSEVSARSKGGVAFMLRIGWGIALDIFAAQQPLFEAPLQPVEHPPHSAFRSLDDLGDFVET